MKLQIWNFLVVFTLHVDFLLTGADQTVFPSRAQANVVFMRPKRANMFLLEEILKGNLERECHEERCNKEEAREVFEDNQKTEEFWSKYYDGDQCLSSPCQHGGVCKDTIGGYSCQCTNMYSGLNCENDVSQCPSDGPLACQHFCKPSPESYKCFCAKGYRLHSDGRSCIHQVQNPCGVVRTSSDGHDDEPNKQVCSQERCPWQWFVLGDLMHLQDSFTSPVILVPDFGLWKDTRASGVNPHGHWGEHANSWAIPDIEHGTVMTVSFVDGSGDEICRGVVLGRWSILTTAGCLTKDKELHVIFGSSNERRNTSEDKWTLHSRYMSGHAGDDLAFLELKEPVALGENVIQLCLPEKDFSENVLMKTGKQGVMVGHPAGSPSYLPLDDCRSKLNLSFEMTNKMFCMDKPEFRAVVTRRAQYRRCDVISGTPVASVEGNTAFLTGLFLSQSDCTDGLVFTKVSRYLPWIRQQVLATEGRQR